MTQQFPKEWLEIAKKKVEASDFNDSNLSLTRHAIDMFSKRSLNLWLAHREENTDGYDGFATFIVKMAQRAWEEGTSGGAPRHANDGIKKKLGDLVFVFSVNPDFPDYKQVVTIMDV